MEVYLDDIEEAVRLQCLISLLVYGFLKNLIEFRGPRWAFNLLNEYFSLEQILQYSMHFSVGSAVLNVGRAEFYISLTTSELYSERPAKSTCMPEFQMKWSNEVPAISTRLESGPFIIACPLELSCELQQCNTYSY